MACYHPITGYKPLEGGALHWAERENTRPVQIACGYCIGCRIKRQREWTVRLMCEKQMHADSMFLTLTYDDDHKPRDNGLCYRDVQLFMKRARKRFKLPLRYFVCGEYGDVTKRPHYHMCLFGLWPSDTVRVSGVYSSNDLYASEAIREVWGHGKCDFGQITPQSAAYTASYVLKKWHGDDREGRYERVTEDGEVRTVEREFAHMSLRPGIGAKWFEKYFPEVMNSGWDAVRVVDGFKPVPRYFVQMYKGIDDLDQEEFMFRLQELQDKNSWNATPARLAVREVVAAAGISFGREVKGVGHAI